MLSLRERCATELSLPSDRDGVSAIPKGRHASLFHIRKLALEREEFVAN